MTTRASHQTIVEGELRGDAYFAALAAAFIEKPKRGAPPGMRAVELVKAHEKSLAAEVDALRAALASRQGGAS